jgi:hypothetical protein
MSRRARHRGRLAPPPCSGDRRARVSGPSEGRVPDREVQIALRWVHAPLTRMLTAFPSSAPRGHPLSPARSKKGEETPFDGSDRPRPPFRRHPAKGGAILKTEVPSTAASQRCERIAPPTSTAASRSRRPHVAHGCGIVLSRGIASARCGGTPPEHSRERAPFRPAGQLVPGTDDPSTPAWLGRRGR